MSKIISENLIPVYEALEMGIAGILTTEEVDDFLNEAFPVTEGASNSEDVANWRDKFLGLIEDVNKQAKSQASYSKVKEYDDCINVSKELIKLCGIIKGMIGRLNPDEQEIIVAWALKHTRSTLGSKQPKKFKDNYYFLSSEYAHMQAYCMKADKLSAKYEKAKKEKKNIKIAKTMIDLMKGMWDLYALINRMTIKKCSKEQQADILLKKSYKKESVEDWTMDMHKLYMDNFFENVNELLEEDEKTYIESIVDTCFAELQDFASVCEATEGTLSDNWVAATQDVFESALSKDEKLFAKAFIEFAEMEHVLEEIDESVFVESSNSEIRAEYRGVQKELRKSIKDYKKALKDGRYSDAKVAARNLHDSMIDAIRKVDAIESDKTTSIQKKALIIGLLEYAALILYLIIFLSSPAAATVFGAYMIYGGVVGLTFITTAEINKWKSKYVKLKENIGKIGKDDDGKVDTLKDEVIAFCYDMAEYASKLETEVDKIKEKREKKDLKKGLKPMSESVHTIGLTDEEVALVEADSQYEKIIQQEVNVRINKSNKVASITNSINTHKLNIIRAVRDGNEAVALKECTALKKDIIKMTNLLVTGTKKNEIEAYSAFYNMEVRTLQAEILYLHNYISRDKKEIARLNKALAKLSRSKPMKKFNEKMRETRYGMATMKEYEDNHKELIEMCKVCSSSMDSIISSIKKNTGKATKESTALSKFEKIKGYLYQECAAGNITLDDRERLILEARELYIGTEENHGECVLSEACKEIATDLACAIYLLEAASAQELNQKRVDLINKIDRYDKMHEDLIERYRAGKISEREYASNIEVIREHIRSLDDYVNKEYKKLDAMDKEHKDEALKRAYNPILRNIDMLEAKLETAKKKVGTKKLSTSSTMKELSDAAAVKGKELKHHKSVKNTGTAKGSLATESATEMEDGLEMFIEFMVESEFASIMDLYFTENANEGKEVTAEMLESVIESAKEKVEAGTLTTEAVESLNQLTTELESVLNDEEEADDDEVVTDESTMEDEPIKGSLTKESTENQSKFEAVKKVLYEKCAEGEITEEQRENLIISARDRYLG